MPTPLNAARREELREHQQEIARLARMLELRPQTQAVFLEAQITRHRISAALLVAQLDENAVPA